uniref:Uncharacterized protein n=2 Tax=Panagrolaimus sp. JU765 TaxID=591449 RepID=A0AC34PWU9_9BILA
MIRVSWTEWSSCTNFAKIRTRSGYCHIQKTDQKLKYEDDGTIFGGFPIETLHRLLENVEEFTKNGIRLFSGIMGDLLSTNVEGLSHCGHYAQQYWVYLENAILDKIAAATNYTLKDEKEQYFVIDSLCYRGAIKKDDVGNVKTRILHGQKLIQNEPCP